MAVDLPVGAQILKFDMQRGVPCIWALVDPEIKERAEQVFMIFGTGQTLNYANIDDIPDSSCYGDITENFDYVTTFQQNDGYLVWHVFKKKE